MDKKEDFKRKRSENWNEGDKMLLKELIRGRVSHIENKNTDTNTNQEKKKAWTEVKESFNNLCTGGQRSVVHLKTQWTATKVVARKQVAEHRKELAKTRGGEAPQQIPLSSADISVWLPNEFVVDTNEFDSDVFVHESVEIVKCTPDETVDGEMKGGRMDKPQTSEEEEDIENIPAPSCKARKKTPAKRRNNTDNNIKRIMEFDIQCSRELHELQIEVEKKKMRNLDREYDLIETKIKYFEKQSVGTYVYIKEEI